MMLVLEHKRGGDLWLLEKYTIIVFLYKSLEIFMGILHVKTPHDLGCIDESLHMLYILESCQKIFRKFIERLFILKLGCGQGGDESLHMLYILESKSKGMYVGLEYSHFTSTNKRSGI
jgi:hypothetical protein